MKNLACFGLAALAGALLAGCATVTPAPAVIKIDHEKVAAALAKGGPLLETNTFKIIAGHRAGPGVSELHEHDTDVFHILEGSATFVTGGTGTEMKPLAGSPGEFRGKDITGGETHHLVKDDVIVVPSGVPHWFKDTSQPFIYFVVKVTK